MDFFELIDTIGNILIVLILFLISISLGIFLFEYFTSDTLLVL